MMKSKQTDLRRVTESDAAQLADIRKALELTLPEIAQKASVMASRREEPIGESFHEKWLAQIEARKNRQGQIQEYFERKKIERLVWSYQRLFEIRGWDWHCRFSWEEQPVIGASSPPQEQGEEFGDIPVSAPPRESSAVLSAQDVSMRGKGWIMTTFLVLSVVVGIMGTRGWIPAFIESEKSLPRVDWISATGIRCDFDILDTTWDIWEERTRDKTSFFLFNHLNYPRAVEAGDSVIGEFRWSYRYIGGTPMVFITMYGEWEPEKRIEVFAGKLAGDGTKTREFRFQAPREPGVYRMRLFYVQAFAPVPSFYGAAGPNVVTAPTGGYYTEMLIEVLSQGANARVSHR